MPIIPRNCPLYLLLDDNLPVQLPGDRGPDEITGIELSVHASQDKLSTILISRLAGEKGQGHESCSTDGSGSSSLSSPLFSPQSPKVRLGSLESEGNAHCHSQIHGTKPRKPGWEPRQKAVGRRRLEDIFLALQVAQNTLAGHPAHLEPLKGRGEMATYGLIDCLCQRLSDFIPEELPLPVAQTFL